ncbi:MAG: N-acetylneuraminate synthase family protein [Gammaproteobacteria bacterium]|nr:N-acetylneuraminate synthase family protein [Gammaproteobacteria bacterium]
MRGSPLGKPVAVSRRPIEVIAEIGINHNGDMDRARDMIAVARQRGADVAKFQIYDPAALLNPEHPLLKPHWDTIRATELRQDNVAWLKAECDAQDIEFLASVFDVERVAWTEAEGMTRYKIASRSLYDAALAAAIKATGKPVLRSWGYYDGRQPPDVGWDVTEMYCISEYPTPLEHVDVAQFTRFGGFSDHTMGITASIMAMAHGARVIEKHFTLDPALPGPDHVCSITPDELERLCQTRDDIERILYS